MTQGLFQSKVMPFGLTNAPATFQKVMDISFAPHLGKVVAMWMISIVYSKTQVEHFGHLCQVFSMLRKAELSAKLSECDFLKAEVCVLDTSLVLMTLRWTLLSFSLFRTGHSLSRQGLEVIPWSSNILQTLCSRLFNLDSPSDQPIAQRHKLDLAARL